MERRDINIVHDTIFSLKEAKQKSFLQLKDVNLLQSTMEDCRIIDMMLMPLYYVWEHVLSQNLSDVKIEQHLSDPYKRFSLSPVTITWELYLLVAVRMKMPRFLRNKKTIENMLQIYEVLINTKETSKVLCS